MLMSVLNCLFESLSQIFRWASSNVQEEIQKQFNWLLAETELFQFAFRVLRHFFACDICNILSSSEFSPHANPAVCLLMQLHQQPHQQGAADVVTMETDAGLMQNVSSRDMGRLSKIISLLNILTRL